MAKKRELTQQEIDERNKIKKQNSLMRKYATKIKNNCADLGLSVMEKQLEFLSSSPQTKRYYEELTHDQSVSAFKAGIERYKEAINN